MELFLTDHGKQRSFTEDDSGQGAAEYALIALLLILVAGGALHLFREALVFSFSRTAATRSGLQGALP